MWEALLPVLRWPAGRALAGRAFVCLRPVRYFPLILATQSCPHPYSAPAPRLHEASLLQLRGSSNFEFPHYTYTKRGSSGIRWSHSIC